MQMGLAIPLWSRREADNRLSRLARGPKLKSYAGQSVNPLSPKDHYSGRTAPLTSKLCILYIYLTTIGTEYFKHGIHSPFFLFKMQFVS